MVISIFPLNFISKKNKKFSFFWKKILEIFVRFTNNINMIKKVPLKITKNEQAFHQMNDVIMQIAGMYVRQHNKMQDFGVESRLCRAQIHTVQAIGNHAGINLTELAEFLSVSKPTISERIKKLIRLKLVKKQFKDGNNKEVMLTLTNMGWSAYHNHEKQHKEVFKLFEEYFGNQASQFLESFEKELSCFLGFLNDVRTRTIFFQ